MKKVAFVLFATVAFLVSLCFFAQDGSTNSDLGTIKGKVTDIASPTRHNLEGAVVTVRNDVLLAAEGGKRSVTANSNGEYVIDDLPPGEYTMTVTNPGYEPTEERVTISPRARTFHRIMMFVKATRIGVFVKGTRIGPPEYAPASPSQMWRGVLDINGTIHRIILKRLLRPPYTATLDSLDQGLEDIPVDNMVSDTINLSFEVKSINATFEGKAMEFGISGEWKQDGKSLPLIFYRHEKGRAEPQRSQEPEKPYPYKEEDVFYRNGEMLIAGTLTLPDSDAPSPAVILMSDYGAHDRDQLQRGLGHRPFLILADYLTRQGVAVLRTDDRGVGWSTGALLLSTFEELADDAVVGIEYLKSRKEISARQIGIIGYGIGGGVAITAATQSENVTLVVLMGGVGLSGEELSLLRGSLIGKYAGRSDKEIARRTKITRRAYAVLRQEEDNEIAMQKIRDIIADVTVEFSETKLSEEDIQAIRTSSGGEYFSELNPYFRSFLTFDPRPALMELKSPILIFNNTADISIPIRQNLDAIETALKAGGNKHYIIREFSDLTVSFQTMRPGVPLSKIEETISPVVLKLIGDWLLEQVSESN